MVNLLKILFLIGGISAATASPAKFPAWWAGAMSQVTSLENPSFCWKWTAGKIETLMKEPAKPDEFDKYMANVMGCLKLNADGKQHDPHMLTELAQQTEAMGTSPGYLMAHIKQDKKALDAYEKSLKLVKHDEVLMPAYPKECTKVTAEQLVPFVTTNWIMIQGFKVKTSREDAFNDTTSGNFNGVMNQIKGCVDTNASAYRSDPNFMAKLKEVLRMNPESTAQAVMDELNGRGPSALKLARDEIAKKLELSTKSEWNTITFPSRANVPATWTNLGPKAFKDKLNGASHEELRMILQELAKS